MRIFDKGEYTIEDCYNKGGDYRAYRWSAYGFDDIMKNRGYSDEHIKAFWKGYYGDLLHST